MSWGDRRSLVVGAVLWLGGRTWSLWLGVALRRMAWKGCRRVGLVV